MSDWQPIETAPKDGSYVFGWRVGWKTGWPIWFALNSRINKAYWKTTDEWDDYEMAEPENAPTHWQPLPKPPS